MREILSISSDLFKIDYSSEKEDDEVLSQIKNFCLLYLNDPRSIDSVSDDELFAMHTFVLVKFNDVKSLMNSLNINQNVYSFAELSKIIDDITLSDSIYSKSERSNLFLLTSKVNYLVDTMSMCYGILKKIGKERGSNLNYFLI